MMPIRHLADRRKLGLALLCAALFTLSACQPPPIQIILTESNGETVAVLKQDWGYVFSDIEPPCVNQIQLIADENYSEPVWSVSSLPMHDGSCRELKGFVVGETPDGFEQEVAMDADALGTVLLTIDGIGYGEAKIRLD